MKHTLETLLMATTLSATGCTANTLTLTTNVPSSNSVLAADGKYDSVDDLINPEEYGKLAKFNYMVIGDSKYKDSKGNEITLHSLGTAVIYTDIGSKTYLATANHVVQNEEILFSFFKGKLEKVSEQFYLLEDYEIDILHDTLRTLAESKKQEAVREFYIKDFLGNKKNPSNNIVRTSSEIASILSVLKPKKIRTVAQNETKDLAVISVPKLKHLPLPYSIGNSKELERQNLLFVVGFPEGLFKTVTRGYVISVNDSRLTSDNPENAFIFDASVSSGNSGGGIFAVRDGKLELVGITSAMYSGSNDLYIGARINGISDVFKGSSMRCEKDWKCNLSSAYELKL